MVRLHTNYGLITMELDHDQAPKTAANFMSTSQSAFTTARCFTA